MTIEERKSFRPAPVGGGSAPAEGAAMGARPAFGKKRPEVRRKVCRLCADNVAKIDYKNFQLLKTFTMESGKILSQRITGTCAKHQRQICKAIKRNRNMAILPYSLS